MLKEPLDAFRLSEALENLPPPVCSHHPCSSGSNAGQAGGWERVSSVQAPARQRWARAKPPTQPAGTQLISRAAADPANTHIYSGAGRAPKEESESVRTGLRFACARSRGGGGSGACVLRWHPRSPVCACCMRGSLCWGLGFKCGCLSFPCNPACPCAAKEPQRRPLMSLSLGENPGPLGLPEEGEAGAAGVQSER